MSETVSTVSVRDSLVLPEVGELVDGAWATPAETLDVVLADPFLGTPVGAAVASSSAAVEAALSAADRVHREGSWAGVPVERRAEILDAVGAALAPEVPRLAALESFATGVPIAQTSIVGMIVPGAFHLAAQMLRDGVLADTVTGEHGNPVEVHRLPLGPALALVPFNAPAPMAAHKIASSLAVGAPTLLKPSEYAPWGTTALARIVADVLDAEGVPAGTFQLLQGGPAVGGQLVNDVRVRAVSFTGGLGGGRAIAAACAANFTALQLELGGNNPLLVMPDADPADAARRAVDLLTTLNGQWCRALGRLVVPTALAEAVRAGVEERLAALVAGDPLDHDTDLGPIIHAVHLSRLRAEIDARLTAAGDAGVLTAPTAVPATGTFLAPTLISGTPSEAALEEVFGPVATMHTYDTLEEAVELANATPFGLEGYVVGTDTEAALDVARRVRAGEVKVNGSTIMSLHLMTPRPAWGLSGMGEEGTVETMRFFTGARVVGVEGGYALHGR
ncbi:aldehyde dehydrogenase family protein [Nocardioides sp. zg-ZUI104]|uniref:aldehyde dehydrogenase family protein n=1 Tax=Nocardioides faecalis TaxID=2803858 RepID=UPI001BCDE5EC|nr:aldehyde dehydrogenase family protein [Nocardioides faecalis]MBS4751439.1 aldehyde dehydrogenase family protein [Nocardioides faecalis]